jgi:hypothetical protein
MEAASQTGKQPYAESIMGGHAHEYWPQLHTME